MAIRSFPSTTESENRMSMWCARNVKHINLLITCASVLLTLITVTYIILSFDINNDRVQCVPINSRRALVYNEQSTCKLWAFDPDKIYAENILINSHNQSNKKCYFDLYMKETIFYNYDFLSIKSTSSKYPEIKLPANSDTISREIPTYGYALAVDYIEENIYALSVDNRYESDKLIVIDFSNRNARAPSFPLYNIVLSNLNSPKHVALDPEYGLMFVIQQSSIYQAELDGGRLTALAEESGISSFAVDVDHKRIWWTTSTPLSSIKWKQYDSLEPSAETKTIISSSIHPYASITHVSGKIFYQSYSIWCYSYDPEMNCPNRYTSIHSPELLRGYDFDKMKPRPERSSCARDNGGCEHLCLRRVDGISCACQLGYVLSEDGRSCSEAPEEYMLYARGRYVGARVVNATWRTPFAELIHPVRIARKSIVSFDLLAPDHVYASDGEYLYSKSLDLASHAVEVRLPGVGAVAVDWGSKQVYVAKSNEVRVLPHKFKSVEMSKVVLKIEAANIEIASLAVHPNEGYLLFTRHDRTAGKSEIYKMNSDGSDVHGLFPDNHSVKKLSPLAVDAKNNRLYWFSENGSYIESTKIPTVDDGEEETGIERIHLSDIKYPTSLHVQDGSIYVGTPASIYLIRKDGAQELVYHSLAKSTQAIAGQVIYKNDSQRVENRQKIS